MLGAHRTQRAAQRARIHLHDLMRELAILDEKKAFELLKAVLGCFHQILPAHHAETAAQAFPELLQQLFDETKVPEALAPSPRITTKTAFMEALTQSNAAMVRQKHPEEVEPLIKSVFRFLASFLSVPQSRELRGNLPLEIRELWPAW